MYIKEQTGNQYTTGVLNKQIVRSPTHRGTSLKSFRDDVRLSAL